MHPAKRGRRAISAVMLVLLGFGTAIGASGCTAPETIPPATPSPTPASTAPVLPTNEEALAIVEELVPRFLAAEAKAVQEGDYDELEVLAAAPYIETVRQGAAALESKGQRLMGLPGVSNFTVQSVQSDQGNVTISTYACQDISAVDVLDSAGNNIQPPDLSDRSTMIYKLTSTDGIFLIEGVEAWSGNGSC